MQAATAWLLVAAALLWCSGCGAAAGEFELPLMEGADPFIVRADHHYYVLITRFIDIAILKVQDLNNLDTAAPHVVFCANSGLVKTGEGPRRTNCNAAGGLRGREAGRRQHCRLPRHLATWPNDRAVLPLPPASEIWAPELHRIGGRWFIYASARRNESVETGAGSDQFVLEAVNSSSPLGPYRHACGQHTYCVA